MVAPARRKPRRYWLRLLAFFCTLVFILPCIIITAVVNGIAISYVLPAHRLVLRPPDLPSQAVDVAFQGGDNLTLRGWYIPPKNNTTIILLHGYFEDRTQMVFHARHLAGAGYGVLLYDERGAGESDGERRSFGWRDVEDVGGALQFLGDKTPSLAIAGCSIGGQIALRAAARYPRIAAVLADGPSMVTAEDLPPGSGWEGALTDRYQWFMDRLLEFYSGMTAPPPLITELSKLAPRPVMFFAGAEGTEKVHIRRYQQAAGTNARLWEIPGATHCDGPYVAPAAYARHMMDFFDDTFRAG